MTAGTAGPSGVEFGPTGSGKRYLSRNDHRNFSKDPRRNKWAKACKPTEEYSIFVQADASGWRDSRPHLWGVQSGLAVLGEDGEAIALFRDSNHPDLPWHGYPVSATDPKRELEHRPEPALVEIWLSSGVISAPQAARINRGKV